MTCHNTYLLRPCWWFPTLHLLLPPATLLPHCSHTAWSTLLVKHTRLRDVHSPDRHPHHRPCNRCRDVCRHCVNILPDASLPPYRNPAWPWHLQPPCLVTHSLLLALQVLHMLHFTTVHLPALAHGNVPSLLVCWPSVL